MTAPATAEPAELPGQVSPEVGCEPGRWTGRSFVSPETAARPADRAESKLQRPCRVRAGFTPLGETLGFVAKDKTQQKTMPVKG